MSHKVHLVEVADDQDCIVFLNGTQIAYSDDDEKRYVDTDNIAERIAEALDVPVIKVVVLKSDVCDMPSEWTHEDVAQHLAKHFI